MSFKKMYRKLFANKFFYKFNLSLYQCCLRGLGILNYENDKISGELSFLNEFFKNGNRKVILDVGANIGKYSENVRNISKDSTIYAFEPHPVTYAKLLESAVTNNLIPINCGVGITNEITELYDHQKENGSGHASLYKDVIEKIHHSSSIAQNVTIVTLDSFAEKENITKIDLLKIDVEGNELNVLKGAQKLLKNNAIDVIQFEFNEMNIISRTFFKDICDYLPDFKFYRLLPDGLVFLGEYSPVLYEIYAFQNIVAFRNP